MTTVARRDPADKAKIDAIEKKLLANPEIAKLLDDLDTSTTTKACIPALVMAHQRRMNQSFGSINRPEK